MELFVPRYVLKTIEKLEDNGFEAWCVGGCVRDSLLHLTPKDYDLATSARPEDCHALFSNVFDTGLQHGTVTVVSHSHNLEITTFRTDGLYPDHRKPETVAFVDDIRTDLARRDFTMNAMAYHPMRGLFDPFGGERDLRERTLRAVGDPAARFAEDALRILRLFRFACRFDFTPEAATKKAALQKAGDLSHVSAERVEKELLELLLSDHPGQADCLFDGGLFPYGLTAKNGSLESLCALPKEREIRFCAFCRLLSVDPQALAVALKSDKSLRTDCAAITAAIQAIENGAACEKELLFRFGPRAVRDARILLQQSTDALNEILNDGLPYRIEDLCVNGHDCCRAGLTGEAIGQTLYALLQRVWNDPSANRRSVLLPLLNQAKTNRSE